MTIVIYSFLGFLSCFLIIGLLSVYQRKKSVDDYLLASREISPAFVGLSAAASTASGFGFTGIIGFGYAMGLSGAWFIFGLLAGSIPVLLLTIRRFRTYSQRHKIASSSDFLSCNVVPRCRSFQILIGMLSIFAVTLYATAQLSAGSKALNVLFGWDYNIGAILGAIIVIMYCWAGGIRASIWTDVAQIVVMFGAMALLLAVSLSELGGFYGLYDRLESIDPKLVSLFPQNNPFGPLLFVLVACRSVSVLLVFRMS